MTNLSYDNQSEGSRGDYIFELIQLSNQKEKIRQVILKALATERKDTWALDQLFDITALFAKQGETKQKKQFINASIKRQFKAQNGLGKTH